MCAKFILITLCMGLSSCWFAQSEQLIISCPNNDDFYCLSYLNTRINKLNEDNLSKTVVIIDGAEFSYIKELSLRTDTNVSLSVSKYCHQYTEELNKVINQGVKVYGTSISSSFVTLLKIQDSIAYNKLNRLSLSTSNLPFHETLMNKSFKNGDTLYSFINENYSFESIELMIIRRSLLKNESRVCLQSFYTSLLNEVSKKNVNTLFLNEWTWNFEKLSGFTKINLIPVFIDIHLFNNRKRINRIKNMEKYSNFSSIHQDDLPRKIQLNDFMKINKRELNGETNILIEKGFTCW